MKKDQWLTKAKALHKTCVDKIAEKNGSVKCTNLEAKTVNELQKAIGSNHGIKEVTYKELRDSLDEMFVMVKAGQKDDLLK
jgi:hypothetical protein